MCYKVSKSQQKVFFIIHLFLFLCRLLHSAPLRFALLQSCTLATNVAQPPFCAKGLISTCPSSTIEAPFSASLAPTPTSLSIGSIPKLSLSSLMPTKYGINSLSFFNFGATRFNRYLRVLGPVCAIVMLMLPFGRAFDRCFLSQSREDVGTCAQWQRRLANIGPSSEGILGHFLRRSTAA